MKNKELNKVETKAIELINMYFHDKKDKDGNSYLDHLWNVASAIEREASIEVVDRQSSKGIFYQKAFIVAILHDILEDTDITEEELYKIGCDDEIVKAVETLKKLGGTIIFLEAEEKTAADRIVREAVFENGNLTNIPAYIAKKNPHTLQDVRTIFHEFYEQRCKQYKKIADIVANVAAVPITENTQHILQLLAATSAAT